METLYLRPGYLPPDLRTQDRWLPWKRHGRKKVPLDRNGKPCDPHNPSYWQSFHDATTMYYREEQSVNGVGFALDDSDIVVVDLDSVVDDAGALESTAREYVDRFQSYAELSPSERGVHLMIEATLPEGNRRLPGIELLGSGFVTLTGHPMLRAPIREGGEGFERLLRSLPPRVSHIPTGSEQPLLVASRAEVRAVLDRAMPNRGFQKLWRGDWSAYPSRSEADAALCMTLARNGGNLSVLIELLRASGLRRPKLLRDGYATRTAIFALSNADVRVAQWSGITAPASNGAEREAISRLQAACAAPLDGLVLRRIASEIAAQVSRGQHRNDGYFRVSPQAIAGDFPPRLGLPQPERIMSRQGCLKAMKRLAAGGVFELAEGEDEIVWHSGGKRRSRKGKTTLVRVDGADVATILCGFADRLSGKHEDHHPPPVYVLETGFHNDESGVAA